MSSEQTQKSEDQERIVALQSDFREAMSRLGAAVNVVTTYGEMGRCGYTGTAVCSLSADPASMIVCLNTESEMNAVFLDNKTICINVLSAKQENISTQFSGQCDVDMKDRFLNDEWIFLSSGAPVLRDALCALDGTIDQILTYGTHSVFLCKIREVYLGQQHSNLMYWERNYHSLSRAE